jgi:hypothetical protein
LITYSSNLNLRKYYQHDESFLSVVFKTVQAVGHKIQMGEASRSPSRNYLLDNLSDFLKFIYLSVSYKAYRQWLTF